MKIAKFIIQITTYALLFNPLFPVYAAPADEVQQTITAMMQKDKIPGVAVVLYVDGKPYLYNFGVASPATKVPVTSDTIFEIGSVTKLFTSILVAEQVDAGTMDLDAPIKNYLPTLSAGFNNVTLKNLGTHTSGLPFGGPETFLDQQSLNRFLSKWEPTDAPGTQWTYSNLGIELLGDSVERLKHKDYNQLCIENILRPLGMDPVAINVPPQYMANLAQGTGDNSKPALPFDTKDHLFSAAGGLKVSARNVQKFLAAAIYLDNTPDVIQNAMRMTQTAYIRLPHELHGLGWQIHPLNQNTVSDLLNAPQKMDFGPTLVREEFKEPFYDGSALLDKTGATGGFRAYIAVIPNRKSGIVILANKNISNAEIVNAGRQILFYYNNLIS